MNAKTVTDSCPFVNAPALAGSRARRASRAATSNARTPLSLRLVFVARAEARALLYAAGLIDLHEAIDPLQAFAVECGLVEQIGQDAVQAILADAFHAVVRGRS